MAQGRVVAVGHVGVSCTDLGRAVAFYRDVVGLKQVIKGEYFNAFEVGDVHFCVTPGQPREVHFDFTTDDVKAMRGRLVSAGVKCSEIEHNEMAGHDVFSFRDPDGHEIWVYNAHDPDMPPVA